MDGCLYLCDHKKCKYYVVAEDAMFKRYMILVVLFFVVVNNRSNSSQISQPAISEMIQALGNASFELREKAETSKSYIAQTWHDPLQQN